jgi:hypothetical protein
MRAAELTAIIDRSAWFRSMLAVVRDSGLPDAWVGAGVLRDLVWGERFGAGFRADRVRDVDVAFYDDGELDADRAATSLLRERRPGIPWEATNQAAVHLWFADHFGTGPVPPLRCTADGVATWPETATAVAVRRGRRDEIEICAPHGLDDLLDGIWRRNPSRITVEQSRERLARHDPGRRWPGVRVVPPG